MPATIRDVVDRAIAAHRALALRAEAVEEEWQYVADLGSVWQARLEHVATERGGEPAEPAVERAVARLAEECELIEDPHRAIDWLSTLPQAVLVALAEPA